MTADKADKLTRRLRQVMARAGGSLHSLQNHVEMRDNNIEREDNNLKQSGAKIMSEAAQTMASELNPQIPPAGGDREREIGQQFVEFLKTSGVQVPGLPTRNWKDRVLDAAIPAAMTAGAVVVAYAGAAFVERQIQKHRETKALKALETTPEFKVG